MILKFIFRFLLVIMAGLIIHPARAQGDARPDNLTAIMDKVWLWTLERQPLLRTHLGLRVKSFPARTLFQAEQDAAFAAALVKRLDAALAGPLPHDTRLDALTVRAQMQLTAAADHYWLGFDITPYTYSFWQQGITTTLAAVTFQTADDVAHYLHLLGEYADRLNDIRDRLQGQMTRGIVLPKAALPGVRALLQGQAAAAVTLTRVDAARKAALTAPLQNSLDARVEEVINGRLSPAFAALLDMLAQMEPSAPDSLGLAQYPGGPAYYRHLIRQHTTLDLDPAHLHETGIRRLAETQARLAAIRRDMGFDGDHAAFVKSVPGTSHHAPTAAALDALFKTHVARMEAYLPNLFHDRPAAAHAVARLPVAAEAGLTFGYYSPPLSAGAQGVYYYNGANLRDATGLIAASLVYHELVPGHHFHIASQLENAKLHPLLRYNLSVAAFNEGWAEYAADLGVEAGAYDDPYARYGRLMMETLFEARLVVDTGLNHFGWSLADAQAYLQQNTFLSVAEIHSEVLRYATDMPGQALAYGVGVAKFRELRQQAATALGARFDLRDFHRAVLARGSLPLAVLEAQIENFIAGP